MKKYLLTALSIMLFVACSTLTVSAAENSDLGGTETVVREDTTGQDTDVVQEPTGVWLLGAGGWWYQNPDGSYPSNGWCEIDDNWYAFDESGYMMTGWYQSKDAWYYLKANGVMAEGWVNDGGTWYYMAEDTGVMKTGWQEIDGSWYYFDAKGMMKIGWLQQGSSWYYLNPDGSMAEGWVNDGGTWYYLNPGSGTMATGWQNVDGSWYYLGTKGVMVIGWFKENDNWYYCYSNGVMAANTFVDGYYVNRNGIWISDAEQIKTEQALAVAWEITDYIESLEPQSDLHRVGLAAYIVSTYCANATYTMEGKDYRTAYGVFVAGEYSCAGATRALGMILDCMGYEWEHVNENQYTHQWVRLTMDGQIGWADGQIGFVGYGKHPVE
ncbi:MAG: hypothetical protein ACI4DO_08425 [Roseburia sp.]